MGSGAGAGAARLGVADVPGVAVSWPAAVWPTKGVTPEALMPAMKPARYSFCSAENGCGSGGREEVASGTRRF